MLQQLPFVLPLNHSISYIYIVNFLLFAQVFKKKMYKQARVRQPRINSLLVDHETDDLGVEKRSPKKSSPLPGSFAADYEVCENEVLGTGAFSVVKLCYKRDSNEILLSSNTSSYNTNVSLTSSFYINRYSR